MLVSNQIKEQSQFNYNNYTLTVVKRNISSVEVINTKQQKFTIDIKLLMDGLCSFKGK